MSDIKNAVKDTKNGVSLSIFVSPGAKNCTFPAGFNPWRNTIEITVCSPAKDNQANEEVRATLARYFTRPLQEVIIVSGKKIKTKQFC